MSSATNHNVYISVYGRTDVGMQRTGNEDAFLVADLTTGDIGLGPEVNTQPVGERGSLLVVSDGMGGAVAGEVASELAVTTLRESLMDMPNDYGAAEQLRMATEIANERIWNHARQNPELTGMGATLTGVLVHSDVAYIAQVGDSRAYLIRGPRIKQLTKDQSLVQMLLDAQAITPDQASQVPQNVIMQALGTQPIVKVVMTGVQLCQNDFLLLCSDGLSNKIGSEEMRQIIHESADINAACRRMIETANERGGEDNITVIIARCDGEALASDSDNMTITGSFVALDDASRRTTQRDLSEIDTSQAASVTTLVVPSFSPATKPEEEAAVEESEEVTTDRLDPTQVAGFDEAPTSRLDQAAVPEIMGDTQAQEEAAPATQVIRATRKKSFTPILIFALIAAMIVAATYFFYRYYILPRRQPRPTPVVVEEQKPEEPKQETPPAEEPKTDQPKSEEPKSEPPKSEPPKSEEPKSEPPKSESSNQPGNN